MKFASIDDTMLGYHVCFWPRGKRVAPPVQQPATPEDIIIRAERTHLVLLAAAEESSPIRMAISRIFLDGLSMADACRLVAIEQYQLHRAIKRIAKRLYQED
jgi:DNA-directed RNA polymerase specialized sigma24 family protein